jgi:DNA topoisomerase-1
MMTGKPLRPDLGDFLKSHKLRYVHDSEKGYTRRRQGKKFIYLDKKEKIIRDPSIIDRINKIGIPPAYKNVWICPYSNGHLQAVGEDSRGRRQYRYHEKWRALRDENKYEHILLFAEALPAIRRRVAKDMKAPVLNHDKVMAAVVSLLEKSLIRVGNDEYAATNRSFGLTTLRSKHARISHDTITFKFLGKSGKEWNLQVHDKRLAKIMRQCNALPGYEIFKYVGVDGKIHDVTSTHVNNYLKAITGQDFTAKDFRTWFGTVLAAMALSEFKNYDSEAQAKKNVVAAIEQVSRQLGNTRAICRKCYVHPEIIDSYMSGDFARMVQKKIDAKLHEEKHLSTNELMVLAFLRRKLSQKKNAG